MKTNQKKRTTYKRPTAVSTIDVEQAVGYLIRQFRQKTESFGRDSSVGTQLNLLQVEFTYLIDSIKRGPKYQISKNISLTNDFLNSIKR
jgi:hypothetical protein